MAKSGPKSNYNDANNYGANTGDLDPNTTGTQNYTNTSMYSDNRYMDGDGTLYWTGMIARRVLVKGLDLTENNGLVWNKASGASDTTATLGIKTAHGITANSDGLSIKLRESSGQNISGLDFYNDLLDLSIVGSEGINVDTTGVSVNYGSGLTIGTSGADEGKLIVDTSVISNTYVGDNAIDIDTTSIAGTIDYTLDLVSNKTNSPYNKNNTPATVTGIDNISGLEVISSSDTTGNIHSKGLKIRLYKQTDNTNVSGLELAPSSTGSTSYVSGLKVKPYTGIKVTSNGVEIDPATTLTNTGTDADKPVTSAHLYNFIGDGLKVSGGSITVSLGDGLVLDSSNPKKITLDLSPVTHYQNGNPIVGTTTPLFTETNKFAIKVADSSGYGVVKVGTNISVNTAGVISVSDASTSAKGVIQLLDSITDSVTTKAPTVNAVYDFVHGLDGDGLGWMSGDSANKLKVKTGNGITVSSDTVGLNPLKENNTDVSGLKFSDGGTYVSVKPGSNITVTSTGVNVDTADNVNTGGSKPPTSTAVSTYVTTAVAEAVSDISGREYKIFSSLPTVSTAEDYETYKKYIALISDGGTPDGDAYIEYILIREDSGTEQDPVYSYRWERVGNTKFVSDDYVKKTDILTQAEISTIVTDVFGF